MSKFIRLDNYDGKALEAARKIRKKCEELNKPTLVIPSTDSLIFYYQGKLFLSIDQNGNWKKKFETKYYRKHFEEYGEIGEHILKCLEEKPEDIEQIYEDNLDIILDCIAKGLPQDKERASQQIIALNNIRKNISSMDNSYFVCGFEAAIPEDYFSDNKKPEIDLIAVNIEKKEILLIEYKCQRGALLDEGDKKRNIAKHCEDYLTILDDETLCNDIKTQMRNAYRLMRKIYMDDKHEESELKLEFKEFEIKIAFLITTQPCEERNNNEKENITLNALKTAKSKLDKCIEDYAKKRESDKDEKELAQVQEELKKRIKCLIHKEPEDCPLEGWENFDKWDKMIK